MTDTDKLKRLAEGMSAREIFGIKLRGEECREYGQAILNLIAENGRLHMILDGKYGAVNDRAFIDAEGSE